MSNHTNTDDEPDFNEHQKGSHTYNVDRPSVTINDGGKIRLNASFKAELGNPEYVILHIDKKRSLLGFESASESDENAYSISHGQISAGSVFGVLEVELDSTYMVEVNTDAEYPYVDLSEFTE